MKINALPAPALMIISLADLVGCVIEGPTLTDPGPDEHRSVLTQGVARQAHCVVNSVAQPIGDTDMAAPSAAPGPAQCFDTFSDAMFAATGGRVRLPSAVTEDMLDDQILNGKSAATLASFVIGIEFVNRDFQGATLTITNAQTCLGFTQSLASMPAGWNDVVTSAKAFSNCNNSVHFENANFSSSGAQINCGAACSFIGNAMNDRTSSIRWTN